MRSLLLVVGQLMLALIVIAGTAQRADAFSVCGYLKYYDSRDQRDSTKIPDSHQYSDRPMRWVTVTIRDENGSCRDGYAGCGESNDGVWGTATSNSSGSFCISNITSGADVYYTAEYQNPIGKVLDDDGLLPRVYSTTAWNLTTTTVKNWNMTCPDENSGACPSSPGDVSSTYPLEEAYANILATFNDVYQWYPSTALMPNGHNNRFVAHYPWDAGTECSLFTGMRSWGYDDFCVTSGNHIQNHLVAHEIGHNVFRRNINFSGDVSLCGGTSGWTATGNERCSMSEGWSDFFAAGTFFYPSESHAWYRFDNRELEGDTKQGNGTSLLPCVSQSTSPELTRGNVARWLWDLHDSTTTGDSGNDNSNETLSEIVQALDEFPSNTTEGCVLPSCLRDRENQESGTHGRNVYDYANHFYWYFGGSNSPYGELNQNCLSSSEAN